MALINILVVDDHEVVRRNLLSLLSTRADWIVCGEAANGVEAVEKVKSLRPNVVLMDVSMPGMNGVEATRIIRQEVPETAVIIISQNDPKIVARQAAESGARAFVPKSDLGLNLLPTIDEVVGGSPRKLVEASRGFTPPTQHHDRSANLLAAIVDSSDDAIISKDVNGIITSWNKGAERIFGHTAEEAIGKNVTLIIPPDRRDEETHILERLRRGERVDHFETIRMRKDGTTLDVSLTISPVRDSIGRVIGASKVARDITAKHRAEERERRITAEAVAAQAKFRAVFEQTTQFAGIMTKDGEVIDANKLSLEACGYTAAEVLGRPFWKTPWWRNLPESQEKIQAATVRVAQGSPYREILHYRWADGTERLVDFALYPIVDNEGEVLFLHPTGVDITEQKLAEEKYRKLAESLEAEVRTRTAELENRNIEVSRQADLLRVFSQHLMHAQDEERRHIARELHDSAGQTLSVLGITLAALVQKVGKKAPELGATAEEIQDLVQQLHREIRTASYLLHPPLLDERGLYSALSWYVQGLVERSGLDIRLDIAEDFARLPREMELVIFRLVQESLTNIHRHSGSKTASIRVGCDAATVTLDVRDQGKGMSPERLQEIQSSGSGVGIRGMRERLRQFEGHMTIESDSRGTRLLATIPIPQATACNPPRPPNPAEPASSAR